MNSLVFVALVLGFPSSVEVPMRDCRTKNQAAYFIAIVVVPALKAVIFSEATWVKSSFTLLEGYPVGRIHACFVDAFHSNGLPVLCHDVSD